MTWAVLGSIWVHLGLLVVTLARCSATGPAEPNPERLITLVAAAPPTERATAGEDPAGAGDGEAGADAGRAAQQQPGSASPALDPEALAALDPEALAALDPALLASLDPEALLALDPALLAVLDPAVLDALAAELDPQALERLRARLPEASPTLSGRPVAAPADPSRDRTDRDAGRDPDDAVADAALAERPRDLPEETSDEQTPPPEEPEEPDEEEPSPEEPDEKSEQEVRWTKYLHADEQDAEAERAASEYISSRDSEARALSRTPVVAEQEGHMTRPLDGVPIQAGSPELRQADGDPETEGGDAPSMGEPVDAVHARKQGGGRTGEEAGRGARGPRDDGTQGGQLARSGRRAEALSGAVVLPGGSPGRDGVAEAPRGEREAASSPASWWAPSVARVVLPSPVVPPEVAAVTTPHPTEATHAAPVPTPDEEADRGGTEQPVEVDETTLESPLDDPTEETEGESEEEPEDEVVEPVESIADLRQDLGWGGSDASRSTPRRTLPGMQSSEGNLPTSNKVVDDDIKLDWVSAVDAVDTPAGRYRALIDEEIERNWRTMDLSLHERALGIQGFAVVVFHVHDNGKVTDKTLMRSSGHASLDGMAMDSIPDKLPRFPKDLEVLSLFHRYTFHYRNPIIVGGTPTPEAAPE